jgi:hypothetical protein
MARPGPRNVKSSAQLRAEGARPARIREREKRETEERGEQVAHPPATAEQLGLCEFFCTVTCDQEYRGEQCYQRNSPSVPPMTPERR